MSKINSHSLAINWIIHQSFTTVVLCISYVGLATLTPWGSPHTPRSRPKNIFFFIKKIISFVIVAPNRCSTCHPTTPQKGYWAEKAQHPWLCRCYSSLFRTQVSPQHGLTPPPSSGVRSAVVSSGATTRRASPEVYDRLGACTLV